MVSTESDTPLLHFKHLGVAIPDIDAALPVYKAHFGYKIDSVPFEYPIQKVRVCFLVGEDSTTPTIELVSPGGKDSPLNTVLAKENGAYHACYGVGDISEATEYARSIGCVIVRRPVSAAAFEGRQNAWLYLPSRQLIELIEDESLPQ